MANLTFYEFFCGGGMARAGLGSGWTCLFANDFDARKGRTYALNWGGGALCVGDIANLSALDLPSHATLAWASFPCQDLSLAGAGAGLRGARSGVFWRFWQLMRELGAEGRAPRLIALENVCGVLTSRGGSDFAAIGEALAEAGYRFGALVIDAAHFVPQSRPRLFIIAARGSIPGSLTTCEPDDLWHPSALRRARLGLCEKARAAWVWWRIPHPPRHNRRLVDLIEDSPSGVAWRRDDETQRLLDLMAPLHRERVEAARRASEKQVGAIFRRTRSDQNGLRRQCAEVRFDGLAGCLRTPTGGSSRQILIVAHDGRVRSRLLTGREAARLMGLPEDYLLPDSLNEALHLIGDGVAPPVVRFLSDHLLRPLAQSEFAALQAAE